MSIYRLVNTFLSLLCYLGNDSSNSEQHQVPESWFLESFSHNRNQGSLENGLTPGLRWEIYKMKLKHPVVPERKEVLTKQTHGWRNGKGAQDSTDRVPNG